MPRSRAVRQHSRLIPTDRVDAGTMQTHQTNKKQHINHNTSGNSNNKNDPTPLGNARVCLDEGKVPPLLKTTGASSPGGCRQDKQPRPRRTRAKRRTLCVDLGIMAPTQENAVAVLPRGPNLDTRFFQQCRLTSLPPLLVSLLRAENLYCNLGEKNTRQSHRAVQEKYPPLVYSEQNKKNALTLTTQEKEQKSASPPKLHL